MVKKERTLIKKTDKPNQKRRLVLICSKGTLDMVYPPFILAMTAAAMEYEVHVYFTFWGMDIINKNKIDNLKIPAVGNPGMPIPTIIGIVPGMTRIATWMMKKQIKRGGFPEIKDAIKMAKENGAKLHACEPTMNVMGIKKEDLIDEVDDIIGAATYLDLAKDADISLFI
jgi:peroxiredoxin family protein|tara:strand:- start:399 stop:908 length:510 start_codon:yes stop_codon:yes gene_type:complete